MAEINPVTSAMDLSRAVGPVCSQEFSAWLMPSVDHMKLISDTVESLAKKWGTLNFEAHLTLFYGNCQLDTIPIDVSDKLSLSTVPFELKLTETKIAFTESNYTQAMYLLFELPQQLQDLSSQYSKLGFEGVGGYALRKPHISLQYSNFDLATKEGIRAELLETFRDIDAIVFDSIKLITSNNPGESLLVPQNWKDVSTFQLRGK
jgi:hypothetical protein